MNLKRILKENYKLIIILLLCISFILASIVRLAAPGVTSSTFDLTKVTDTDRIILKYNNTNIELEVAQSPAKLEEGLMFRKSLGENKGMIFIFKSPQKLSFWMKNTLISLDIIYLDQNLTVINFYRNAKPNQTTELYNSKEKAMYTIEVQAGWADQHELVSGSKFILESVQK